MKSSNPILLCAALLLLALSGCAISPRANQDKVVVIAGASSGFGKGVALELAGQGAKLVLAARRTELLEQLAAECEQRGGKAVVVTTDVSDEAQVRRLAETAVEQFGSIDVWINMAGVGAIGRFEEIPLADHHRLLDINVGGVVNGSYYALKQFREQGAGTLINIASVAGRVPFPYYSSYVASKHALIGLGAAINQELRLNGEKNIRVSTISPFAADTPWFDHAANYSGHKARQIMLDPPEKVIDSIVAATVRPKPDINVGYKAKASVASHRIAQQLTRRMVGNVNHKVLMEDAAPAPQTAGALYEPVPGRGAVDGGMRKRLAEGDLRKVEDLQAQDQ
ncbi:SDR family NAD(P)-dependent oxidoreductase [Steroidobacter sp. S1-65]|uniref:SDR family NAD(P)-dependent oxidoreductase n=1 Tax=Steroidobacter gossypii TaxID=2805490 RepID=A0ABS1WQV8_9GAMM|nr:SDR family NAD(P)-dependent oxidoreductase [Steroidobacter gossypii]MBM0103353.1 SDR family NAD(P)-dependent oxidoreductase [Steroidobacter gossypii]